MDLFATGTSCGVAQVPTRACRFCRRTRFAWGLRRRPSDRRANDTGLTFDRESELHPSIVCARHSGPRVSSDGEWPRQTDGNGVDDLELRELSFLLTIWVAPYRVRSLFAAKDSELLVDNTNSHVDSKLAANWDTYFRHNDKNFHIFKRS
jgi:hypothetical protein